MVLLSACTSSEMPALDTLGDISRRHDENPSKTMESISSFVEGYRLGHLHMYRRQKTLAYEWGIKTDYGKEDDEFMKCILSNDSTTSIYARLLNDATDSPDKSLMSWLSSDFLDQCGDKLEAAIRDQYST